MKTKDIIKGRRYTHKEFPEAIYLGSRNNRNEPQMIVVKDPHWNLEGNVVKPKDKDFWQGFSII